MKFPTYVLSSASVLALAAAQSSVTCQTGAHVIVARASNEPAGYGIIGAVKDMILQKIPNSDSVAVPYPATIFGPLYIDSEPEGVGNLTILIKQYADACPDGKIALLGYSQGAQVIGDTLIGSDYEKFDAFKMTTGIDQKYIDQIFAVVMMGDPANVAGQPFLLGNSTMGGNFPRNNTAKWASTGLVPKLQSYCDYDDLFCAHGKSLDVHVGYVPEYGSRAAQFVVDKFKSTGNSTGNSTSSATSTGGYLGGPSATATSGSTISPSIAVGTGANVRPGIKYAVATAAGIAITIALAL